MSAIQTRLFRTDYGSGANGVSAADEMYAEHEAKVNTFLGTLVATDVLDVQTMSVAVGPSSRPYLHTTVVFRE